MGGTWFINTSPASSTAEDTRRATSAPGGRGAEPFGDGDVAGFGGLKEGVRAAPAGLAQRKIVGGD